MHVVVVAAPPSLNSLVGHVWHSCVCSFQNSSLAQDVHDVDVAAPPGLNEPVGHVWHSCVCSFQN